MKLPLESITVGDRRREDYGDIAGLAESIRTYGLLHPIVVDDTGTLVAGERRLRAVQSLGWESVDVRDIGELSEAERNEIELEENLQRKDLTAHERSKTVTTLAETAKTVLIEQAETCAESAQVSHPSRGPARTPGSLRDVAERIGVPEAAIARSSAPPVDAEAPAPQRRRSSAVVTGAPITSLRDRLRQGQLGSTSTLDPATLRPRKEASR